MPGRALPLDTSVHLMCLGVGFVVAVAVFVVAAAAASHLTRPDSRLEMVLPELTVVCGLRES